MGFAKPDRSAIPWWRSRCPSSGLPSSRVVLVKRSIAFAAPLSPGRCRAKSSYCCSQSELTQLAPLFRRLEIDRNRDRYRNGNRRTIRQKRTCAIAQDVQNTALRTPADGIPSFYEPEGRHVRACLRGHLNVEERHPCGSSINPAEPKPYGLLSRLCALAPL
jgi:hypothetical protein